MQDYIKKILPIKIVLILFIMTFSANMSQSFAQIDLGKTTVDLDYSKPHKYEIGGVKVQGIEFLDEKALIMI